MKKLLYIIPVGLMFLNACKSGALEDAPLNLWKEEYVFDTTDSLGDFAKGYLTEIYTDLPKGFNRINNNILDAASDDAISSQNASTIERFTNGQITAFNNPDDAWAINYEGIRRANKFLTNIDKIPFKKSMLQEKAYWISEAKFLRAYFYFELFKRYGGVPLIGDKVLGLSDDLSFARNTTKETTDYILAQLEEVISTGRPDPIADGNLGRATRGTAMALKARLLLYLASPLYNTTADNIGDQNWEKAADAAKAVMNLNVFSLHSSFSTLFTTRKTSEVIFAYQRANTNDVENNNTPIGYAGPVTANGYTSPTQELVDAFEMKDGKPYTSSTLYNAATPYLNRDPRFYLTVFHNDFKWLNRNIETFEGGKDKPGGTVTQTRTGYYMRKFMADFTSSTVFSSQTHNFPLFRYAEILLNFAEARNEFSGPDAEVYKAIEDIRKRAGLSPFTLDPALTRAQMREVIRHERRVEMAFEEQRFWDIRRWKIAETVLNGTLHGMKITKTGTALTFERSDALKVNFVAPKMYTYPIPYDELTKNNKLTQNQGW